MRSCVKTPKAAILRQSHNAKPTKSEHNLNFCFKILQESMRLSIEQYKILSTILMTINGAGVISLLNKDISKYSDSIYSFSLGLLAAAIFSYVGFIFSSQHIGSINKEISSKASNLNMFKILTKHVSFFILSSMFSFFASILGLSRILCNRLFYYSGNLSSN